MFDFVCSSANFSISYRGYLTLSESVERRSLANFGGFENVKFFEVITSKILFKYFSSTLSIIIIINCVRDITSNI